MCLPAALARTASAALGPNVGNDIVLDGQSVLGLGDHLALLVDHKLGLCEATRRLFRRAIPYLTLAAYSLCGRHLLYVFR
jgi:hypothetical protein